MRRYAPCSGRFPARRDRERGLGSHFPARGAIHPVRGRGGPSMPRKARAKVRSLGCRLERASAMPAGAPVRHHGQLAQDRRPSEGAAWPVRPAASCPGAPGAATRLRSRPRSEDRANRQDLVWKRHPRRPARGFRPASQKRRTWPTVSVWRTRPPAVRPRGPGTAPRPHARHNWIAAPKTARPEAVLTSNAACDPSGAAYLSQCEVPGPFKSRARLIRPEDPGPGACAPSCRSPFRPSSRSRSRERGVTFATRR